jgi:UDP-N-acetylmuramoyl-L-alanyl-D-glutamate--2,6-diaminopimelate ligase
MVDEEVMTVQAGAAAMDRGGVLLRELAVQSGTRLCGDGGVMVAGVQQDSRAVEPGDLFVALQGATRDGASYIEAAAERGAVAVLIAAEREIDAHGLARLEASHPRRAMAELARVVYGDATASLQVVGITGTNGKTTTAHLLTTAIRGAGGRPAVVGTLGNLFEGWQQLGAHTSPEADELQRVAAEVKRQGASHLVMEVSSIGLAADRLAGVSFDVAAFTNLTQDHLDYHGSMAAYAAAKEQLFFDFEPRVSVIHVDDPHGADLARRVAAAGGSQVMRVSAGDDPDADICATAVSQTLDGIDITARTPAGVCQIHAPLLGDHNVANLLLTLGVIVALGLDADAAGRALADLPQVPGRLERCDEPGKDDIIVLVDYAHTPDALRHALASLRPLAEGQLWCVFGCGGDRDKTKRGPMGATAARLADQLIVTNDNPRSESPERIAEAVVAGIASRVDEQHRPPPHVVELDRARAIQQALTNASPGDVVLIAGKGHEAYQIIGREQRDFDDRVEARRALVLRRGGSV